MYDETLYSLDIRILQAPPSELRTVEGKVVSLEVRVEGPSLNELKYEVNE